LKRSSMLKSSKIFAELFDVSKGAYSVKGKFLTVKFRLFPSEKPQAKVGFVVGKRWVKRAVDRNFVKRRLREAYRQQQFILVKDLSYLVNDQGIELIFIYRSRHMISSREIFVEVSELMLRMSHRLRSIQ